MGRALSRSIAFVGLTAFGLLFALEASAQSSADKATARELAQEGIKAEKAGDYKTALDRLQKAEALYDAPVHLIHIARCQVKVGKLVDASETYRKLLRSELPPGAPPAFKEAVDAGQPELDQLLPRIPKLTVNISPEGLEGLEVTVDGQPLAAVALGIPRPADPGDHTIVAKARGYHAASQTVTLKEGGSGSASLSLERDPNAVVEPVAGGGTSTGGGTSGASTGAGSSEGNGAGKGAGAENNFGWGPRKKGLNFLTGLRLAGSMAGATARKDNGSEMALSDLLKPGAGLELQLGFNFKELFTAWLFAQPQWYAGNTVYYDANKLSTVLGQNVGTLNTAATAAQAGLGFSIGTAPGQWGGYGELGLGVERLNIDSDFDSDGGQKCTYKEKYSGAFLRVGGGGTLPVSSWLQLNPFLLVSLGNYDSYDANLTCGATEDSRASGAISSSDQVMHSFVQLGIGGQLMYGL